MCHLVLPVFLGTYGLRKIRWQHYLQDMCHCDCTDVQLVTVRSECVVFRVYHRETCSGVLLHYSCLNEQRQEAEGARNVAVEQVQAGDIMFS